MTSLLDTIPHTAAAGAHRPWPRVVVDAAAWNGVARDLAAGKLTLMSLWADSGAVHMGLVGAETGDLAVVSLERATKSYPSVGALHSPAIRFERAIRDLYGLEPVGLWDLRPWLDFGVWEV